MTVEQYQICDKAGAELGEVPLTVEYVDAFIAGTRRRLRFNMRKLDEAKLFHLSHDNGKLVVEESREVDDDGRVIVGVSEDFTRLQERDWVAGE